MSPNEVRAPAAIRPSTVKANKRKGQIVVSGLVLVIEVTVIKKKLAARR